MNVKFSACAACGLEEDIVAIEWIHFFPLSWHDKKKVEEYFNKSFEGKNGKAFHY